MTNQSKDHFNHLIHLINLEAEAEKEESLQAMQRLSPAAAESTGFALINLVIRTQDYGFGGKVLITFGKRNQTLPLPWTKLRSGTPVIVSDGNNQGWRGIITHLNRSEIQVAFPGWPESEMDTPLYRLDRATDEISRSRQMTALKQAQAATSSRLAILRDILFGTKPPLFTTPPILRPFYFQLNPSQKEAIQFVLSAEDIAIIHGPPGTGKTTTVVELIRQITNRGEKVLAVAPSNTAVDNILEKLISAGENAVRLGHPARVSENLRDYTLDFLAHSHPDGQLAQKLTREAHQLLNQAEKFTRAKPLPGERQAKRAEARQILAEAQKIEKQIVERLLNSAAVICSTLTGLDDDLLKDTHFDWCIIDEASQSTEPSSWIPLKWADRLVLAGDHYQLPPTVLSQRAAAQGFSTSLMERLLQVYGTKISKRLTIQYRMHEHIMQFSSKQFYENSLLADQSVQTHLLRDLPSISSNEITETAVHYIDTAGASYDEEMEPDGDSRFNRNEAQLVSNYFQKLINAGLSPSDIAIITPYSAQVRFIRDMLQAWEIEIDSVDGFQGREKEAVIVSLVRSNPDHEIGFLEDVRRMNVALTRARRKLIVIGDSATITIHPFYQQLVTYFESIGAYHSVWEDPLV